MACPSELPGKYDSEALKNILSEHRVLFETIQFSPIRCCVYDPQDRLIAWNKAYEENFPNAFEALRDKVDAKEITFADIIKHELSLTLPEEEVELETARRVALWNRAENETLRREHFGRTLHVHKYRLPSGAVAGLAVDITELKEREAELSLARRKAEQSEAAKTRFLANVSHEIRTPMNGILGLANLLAEMDLTQDQRDIVNTIENSAEALLATINEVLDFSKIDAGKLEITPEPFDLRRLATEVLDLLTPSASIKGVELMLIYPPEEQSEFVGDALRIRQCLLNLVGNAVKFTDSGAVTISISSARNGEVALTVKDTGIGIAPEDISNIFRAFEQTDTLTSRRFDGTGLGLAITQKLVDLMNGRIAVSSKLGFGSTFTIELPLVAVDITDDVSPSPPPVVRSAENLTNLRVLLAEDNDTNRFVVEKMLGDQVSEIITALDGQEAVERFQKVKPDIVLMDCYMPRMNGLEATREIRRFERAEGLARAPIIAFTANAMAEDRAACFRAGMDDFVSKPTNKAKLLDAIGRHI